MNMNIKVHYFLHKYLERFPENLCDISDKKDEIVQQNNKLMK